MERFLPAAAAATFMRSRLVLLPALALLAGLTLSTSLPTQAQEATPPLAVAAGTSGLTGVLLDGTLYSPILGRSMPYRIYLPPDYVWNTTRRYPTLYMLHGAGGNFTEWSDSYLPQQLDDLIGRGQVQPMIVVMPDGAGRSGWANWDNGGPRYADYVAQDVVAEIDRTYRTLPAPTSRAIGGLSMGGVGALEIAMRNPTVFGAVGAHSPSVRLEPDQELWYLSGENFLEQSPIWLAQNWPGTAQLAYWVDVGADDWWRPNVEELEAALVTAGLNVSWHVLPGTHEAEYWIEHVPEYLRFYSDALRA